MSNKVSVFVQEVKHGVRTFNNKNTGQLNYVHEITVRFPEGNYETGQYISTQAQSTKIVANPNVAVTLQRDVKVNGQYTNITYKPDDEGQSGKKWGGSGGGSYAPKVDKPTIILQSRVALAGAAFANGGQASFANNYAFLCEQTGLNKYIESYKKELSTPAPTPTPAPAPMQVETPPAPIATQINNIAVDDDLPF
jgi:hypothetical protein